MHSDQTRKDGSSESMIQALYYDFVANYVKTRMYSIRVMCSVTVEVRAVLTEELLRVAVQKYCPARDLAIALSVRKLDTSCPLVVGEAGVGVTPGPSHWKSRSMWSCYSLSGLMYSTSVTVVILSLAKVHLLIARSCRLPRCNSLDDKIKECTGV